jgi:hypothetical protein
VACPSRRRSPRSLALVAAVAAALLTAPGAQAAESFETVELGAKGSLRVVWHGDPAAGCAAAGMCAYYGSTTYHLARRADIDVDRFDGEVDVAGFIAARGRSEAVVRRVLPGGGTAVCRDGAQEEGFTLDMPHAYRDRYTLTFGTDITPSPLVSGSCAGPRLPDIEGSLPTRTMRLRDLKRKGARHDLSGRFRFRAGPVSGEVISTLVLTTRRVTKQNFGGGGPGSHTERTRPAVFADLEFAVADAHGFVNADFHALDTPICERFDACDASGVERYSLIRGHGRLQVFAVAYTKQRLTLEQALRRAVHGGELDGFGLVRSRDAATFNLFERPGVPNCIDHAEPPPVSLTLAQKEHRARMTFGEPGFDASSDAGADLLDARCAGPIQGEVLQGVSLGNGAFPAAALAQRDLHLVLSRRRPFTSGAYRGVGKTHIVLDLKRVRASVSRGTVTEVRSGGGGGSAGGTIGGGGGGFGTGTAAPAYRRFTQRP